MIKFPASIKIENLEKTSPQYCGKKIELYDALYEGGKKFRNPKILAEMLIKRKIEHSDLGAGQWPRRCERAAYVNRAGGLIDWFVAGVFPDDIMLVPSAGADAEYWESLNQDADGLGMPFGTLCRKALLEMLVQGRAYFRLIFGDDPDAKWTLYKAADIDDWIVDDLGGPIMFRAHGCEDVRSDPFAQADQDRHTWTYYSADAVAIYEVVKKKEYGFQPNDIAKKIGETRHDFGAPPLFDVRANCGQWAMDRIFEVIKAVFNREASITWALDMQAYAQPVITIANARNVTLCGSELHAIKLEPGESFTYSAPPPGIFEPLFKDADRLNSDFHAVIQAMAINAAAIPQAGRLSGDAVGEMRQPMRQLLLSFSWPIKEAATRAVNALLKYRDEPDGSVTIEGMDSVAEVSDEDVPYGEDDGRDGEPADPAEAGGEDGGGKA